MKRFKESTHAIPSGNLHNLIVPISKEKGSPYYKDLRKCLTFIVYFISLCSVNDSI